MPTYSKPTDGEIGRSRRFIVRAAAAIIVGLIGLLLCLLGYVK